MEALADPLSCVRRWVQAGAPQVDLQGQTISLMGQRFDRDEPTAFRKYNTGMPSRCGELRAAAGACRTTCG